MLRRAELDAPGLAVHLFQGDLVARLGLLNAKRLQIDGILNLVRQRVSFLRQFPIQVAAKDIQLFETRPKQLFVVQLVVGAWVRPCKYAFQRYDSA